MEKTMEKLVKEAQVEAIRQGLPIDQIGEFVADYIKNYGKPVLEATPEKWEEAETIAVRPKSEFMTMEVRRHADGTEMYKIQYFQNGVVIKEDFGKYDWNGAVEKARAILKHYYKRVAENNGIYLDWDNHEDWLEAKADEAMKNTHVLSILERSLLEEEFNYERICGDAETFLPELNEISLNDKRKWEIM